MIVVIFIVLIFILLYLQGTRNFKYWEKKNVKYCKPVPFFGNNFRKYFQLISPTDQVAEIYRSFPNEQFVGVFESNHVALVLRDPNLVKHVLVADFIYFHPKGMNMYGTEPLMDNLFSADGDMWKLLRQKMSCAFTTGKFKAMFPVLLNQADRLNEIVLKAAESDAEVNVRDLMGRYAIDAIVACGFGVDTNSLNDDSSIFRKLGTRVFNITLRDRLVFMSKFIASDTFKHLKFFAPEVESMVVAVVKNLLEARNGKTIGRKDFVDMLIELKNQQPLVGESLTKRDINGKPEKAEVYLDDMLLTAQAFILFGAGYETSAATMSFTLNQLAYHPEIQEKCQREIDKVLQEHGTLCYDAVVELKYLEMVFKEGLRMFPPIGFLKRECAKEFTFPGTNLTIDKGVAVLIPVQAMQNDEKYFEKPDQFIPERFHPDNAKTMNRYAYLPFGAGPRICIGQRFGVLESLLALATILSKHTVVPSVNSQQKLPTDPTIALVQNIKGGIPLKFVRRFNANVLGYDC